MKRVAIVLMLLVLGGCAVSRPPAYDSPVVAKVCNSADGEQVALSYADQQRLITVDFVATWEELYQYCGNTGGACTSMQDRVMYILQDRRCAQHASHELAHVFGVEGVDVVQEIASRRQAFGESASHGR